MTKISLFGLTFSCKRSRDSVTGGIGIRDQFRLGGLRSVARIFSPLLARKSSGFARILPNFIARIWLFEKFQGGGGCSPPAPPPPPPPASYAYDGRYNFRKLGVKISVRLQRKKGHETARLKAWRFCVRGKICRGGSPPPPPQCS